MELIIDTSDKTHIAIRDREKVLDEIVIDLKFSQSEELLRTIDELLIKNKINKSDLAKIYVNSGPGSYTGIRVGVSTANFLAFSLNIPVSDVQGCYKGSADQFDTPVSPKYLKPPFITSKKT